MRKVLEWFSLAWEIVKLKVWFWRANRLLDKLTAEQKLLIAERERLRRELAAAGIDGMEKGD
jgi:hypothetical protein